MMKIIAHALASTPVPCLSLSLIQILTSRIAYERPENPLQFMLDEIAKVQKGEVLEELKTSS